MKQRTTHFHINLLFSPKSVKIGKTKKLVCIFQSKTEYIVQIRTLKQALNDGLQLKYVYTVNKFNQRACLKLYIDMSYEKNEKINLEKIFSY